MFYKIMNDVRTVLLSAAICSTIAADSSTGTYIIHYSIERTTFFAEYTLLNNCNFYLIYRYSLSVKFKSITV
jgi:hypothetical protein